LILELLHFQVDHYIDAEIPVIINKRFLHQHSRHIDDKHLSIALVSDPSSNRFLKYLYWRVNVRRNGIAFLFSGLSM
jgi:hypothetical protein